MRKYGDPVLRSRARPVEVFDGALADEIRRMGELMDDALGIGLAATQLGVMHRVLVYRVDFKGGAPSSIGRLGVPIDIWQARPGSSPRCGAEWRAALSLGRGNVARAVAFGVEVRVLRKLRDGAYLVRVSAG